MGMDRVIEKKKGIKRKHIFWALGVIVLGYLIAHMLLSPNQSSLRVDREKISIEQVLADRFNDYVRVVGQVEPISTIYLDAEEGGRVKERLIEEGATVVKGDVILKLENRTLYQDIMNSESNLAQKENMLRQTRINFETERIETKRRLLQSTFDIQKRKRNYEQQKALYEEKLVAKEEYLKAKEDFELASKMQEINVMKSKNDSLIRVTEIAQLGVDLAKMRKTLDLVYERLDNLNVKAPVDGQLGMLDAEIGQNIGRGMRIGQINVLTNYKVKAEIDEHYIDRVRRELAGTLKRHGNEFALTVKKVYPEVRDGQFEIDMVFTGQKPEKIRTGQSYHINLELGQPQEAILIPRGGFFQSTGGQWIYVLDESGAYAEKRSIRIGKQNPQYYEVLEGLKAGEQVITSGYETFGDNDRLILK